MEEPEGVYAPNSDPPNIGLAKEFLFGLKGIPTFDGGLILFICHNKTAVKKGQIDGAPSRRSGSESCGVFSRHGKPEKGRAA